MSIYSIPAMSLQSEFADLTWLGKYVDSLLATSGDQDYAVVYEWGDEGPGDWPPAAVLYRVEGEWVRRGVLVTIMQKKDGTCYFEWEVDSVNPH